MFAPFINEGNSILWRKHQRADVVAVAANAEQVTEQKNLNKWPHKIQKNIIATSRIMVTTFM
jgi:hypothetical protein